MKVKFFNQPYLLYIFSTSIDGETTSQQFIFSDRPKKDPFGKSKYHKSKCSG